MASSDTTGLLEPCQPPGQVVRGADRQQLRPLLAGQLLPAPFKLHGLVLPLVLQNVLAVAQPQLPVTGSGKAGRPCGKGVLQRSVNRQPDAFVAGRQGTEQAAAFRVQMALAADDNQQAAGQQLCTAVVECLEQRVAAGIVKGAGQGVVGTGNGLQQMQQSLAVAPGGYETVAGAAEDQTANTPVFGFGTPAEEAGGQGCLYGLEVAGAGKEHGGALFHQDKQRTVQLLTEQA